jgi:hypothetical protein
MISRTYTIYIKSKNNNNKFPPLLSWEIFEDSKNIALGYAIETRGFFGTI